MSSPAVLTIFGTGLSNFIGVYMISRSAEGTLKLPAKVTAALAAVHIQEMQAFFVGDVVDADDSRAAKM